MIGIYARQSIYKKDSISIEAQIDLCRKQAGVESVEIYEDAGFSRKNTKRPAFQRMMRDAGAGKLNKIICYRIDRISRSVANFGEMWDEISKYGVISIHAPTKGATGGLAAVMAATGKFQSTHPQRVRRNSHQRHPEPVKFQSTHPQRVRLWILLLTARIFRFQSTHPQRVRQRWFRENQR